MGRIDMTDKNTIILDLIKRGKDNEALALLYKFTLPKIRNYILRNNGNEDDVKDIFQDAVVIFYRKAKTGQLADNNNIDGFIYSISRNLYLNHISRYANRNIKMDVEDRADSSGDFEQQLLDNEKQDQMDKLLSRVGTVCMEILKLSIFHRYSMIEIAEKMGYATADVAKSKSYKCRQQLSELLKGNKELINMLRS